MAASKMRFELNFKVYLRTQITCLVLFTSKMDERGKFYKLGFHHIERREEESEDEINNEQLWYYLDLETKTRQLQQRFEMSNTDVTRKNLHRLRRVKLGQIRSN